MSRTIEQTISFYEKMIKNAEWSAKLLEKQGDYSTASELREDAKFRKQMTDWLRELQERRKAPEIVTCYECKHYTPVSQTSNSWGKCSIHSSPTEKQRTCQSCDYCSWAERRTE